MKNSNLTLLAGTALVLIVLASRWQLSLTNQRFHTHEAIPTIGEPAPTGYVSHPHGALASSTEAYLTMISPGGSFRVGIDETETVRLVFSTADNYSTPEGISTASTLQNVLDVSRHRLVADENFGYTVKLPSGWYAHFKDGNGRPAADTRVSWVFNR